MIPRWGITGAAVLVADCCEQKFADPDLHVSVSRPSIVACPMQHLWCLPPCWLLVPMAAACRDSHVVSVLSAGLDRCQDVFIHPRPACVSKQGMLQTVPPPLRRDNFQAHSDGLQGCCQGAQLSLVPTALSGAVQGPDAAGARYALVGVVEHQGTTLSNGHYVAFVQRGLSLPACPAVAVVLQQHCPPAEPAPAGSHSNAAAAAAADAEGGDSSSSRRTGAAAETGMPSCSSQSSGAAGGRGWGTSAGALDGHRRKRSHSPAESSSRGSSSDAAAGGGGARAGLAGGKAEAVSSGSSKAEATSSGRAESVPPSSGSGGPAAEAGQGSASPSGAPDGKDDASAKPSGAASHTAKPDLVDAEMPPDDWEAKAVADSSEDVEPPQGSAEVSAAPAGETGPAAASPENHTCSSSEAPIPSASEPLCDSAPVENARQESDLHATSAPLENGETSSSDAHSHSESETRPLPERTDGSQISNGLQSGPPAWYCISDTQVKSVSAADVMACEVYLLLYTRIA